MASHDTARKSIVSQKPAEKITNKIHRECFYCSQKKLWSKLGFADSVDSYFVKKTLHTVVNLIFNELFCSSHWFSRGLNRPESGSL